MDTMIEIPSHVVVDATEALHHAQKRGQYVINPEGYHGDGRDILVTLDLDGVAPQNMVVPGRLIDDQISLDIEALIPEVAAHIWRYEA